MAEIVVVGAGACGSLAAKSAALRGASVLILEEDLLPGKFHKCSGLYSKKGLQRLGIAYENCVLHEVRGANVYAGGHSFAVDKRETVAFVLDRQKLDEQLCQEAIDAGAVLKLGQRVQRRTCLGIATKDSNYGFRFLIGADGVSSAVAYMYGFPPIGNGNIAMCYEAEFDNCRLAEADKVDVFLDAKLFPGFFGWIIPAGKAKARIGFGTTCHSALKNSFEKFFQIPLVRQTRGEKVREFWHAIPLRTRRSTEKGNVLLVGDAAGQVKASSGGGVVFGGQCAQIAGEVAARNCAGERLSYERKWRERFGKVLKTHRFVRKVFDASPSALQKLTVVGFDKLFVNKLLEKYGDMDLVASIRR